MPSGSGTSPTSRIVHVSHGENPYALWMRRLWAETLRTARGPRCWSRSVDPLPDEWGTPASAICVFSGSGSTGQRKSDGTPHQYSVSSTVGLRSWRSILAHVFILLQGLGDRLARFGLGRRETEAELLLSDADQARCLIDDPALWSLWMPGVQDMHDEPRPPRQNARYRVTMRMRSGRMGLSGGNRQAHVQIVSAGSGRLAWQLLRASTSSTTAWRSTARWCARRRSAASRRWWSCTSSSDSPGRSGARRDARGKLRAP